MKKAPSKLTLRRETLRLLGDSALKTPAGGGTDTPCPFSVGTFTCATDEVYTCDCSLGC